ncbi:hypothetical protein [Lentibacillus kapialis]|nr:hypothetical protein [Lentibacillus kapialis]
MNIDVVREVLPEKNKEKFDDIVFQRVLGASKHINMIADMIESIALEGRKKQSDTSVIVDNIQTLTHFFISTRGEASQAIENAINLMTKNIDDVRKLKINEAVTKIIKIKDNYLLKANEDLDKVVNHATKVAEKMRKIMVFDYSSTVDKFLKSIKPLSGDLTVIIPESRSIDGGQAFVKTCIEAGHNVKFIPDTGIMYFLEDCDGAFLGAETFFPDGTVFNTTGSDIVGLACKEFNVPLFALTPLIKVDIRSIYGYDKELVINDLKGRLAGNWHEEEIEQVDFECPELLGLDPKYVTAIITEEGKIPSNQLFNISINYHKSLKGDK